MTINQKLVLEAVDLTAQESAIHRTDVDRDVLLSRFVAEFVAESESLEGYESKASDVFDSVRDLSLPA
jgi:hypothetical protein